MLPYGWNFRSMKSDDLDDVLEIINEHDEDDFEDARESYDQYGLTDQYVFTYEDNIMGVTGFRYEPDTDNTYWLSWTYLTKEQRGQQMGTRMIEELFEILKKEKARKIFVSTSDYIDPEEGSIYKTAVSLYRTMGFKEEIIHRDFYEPGESELIFGNYLQPRYPQKRHKPEKRGVVLDDLYKIDETDDLYAIEWEFIGKKVFSENDINMLLDKAKGMNARSVLMAFPSNVHKVNDPLRTCGFQPLGMLEDFYQDDLHKIHFRYDFK